MLTLLHPSDTWMHRLPAGPKLAALPLVSMLLVAVPSLPLTAAVLACALGLLLSGGRAFARTGLRAMRPIAIFVAVMLVWFVLTDDATEGLRIVGRILALVALAQVLTMTTRFEDIMAVLSRILRPVPFVDATRFGFAAVLVLRMTHVLAQKGRMLSMAWAARSRRRPGWQVVMPWILVSLDDAVHVSDAVRARGGLPSDAWTQETGAPDKSA